MAYGKRRTYKKKSFSKKRKYSKKRKTTKKRSYVKNKRSRSSPLGHVSAPSMRMNVIPRTADRLHVKLDYKMKGELEWKNTAENHIGMTFLPTYLGAWNASNGPFKLAWPATGTNVNFPHAVSSTPGFFTLVSRYGKYVVNHVKLTVRCIRQEATDSTTCVIGMMPWTDTQFTGSVSRNSTLSPSANLSVWLPQNGLSAATVATTNIYNSQLMTIRQQPYVKMRQVSMPYNGKMSAIMSQSYSAKKFFPFGYPYGDQFSGELPDTAGSDGTPPTAGFHHYFFMQRTSAVQTGSELFDLEFDMQISCTFHEPGFMQSAPLFTMDEEKKESKEEKKTEFKQDEAEDEDLVDMSGLSLQSPKPSESSLQRAPTLILKTCLNSAHPADPHKVVDSCV